MTPRVERAEEHGRSLPPVQLAEEGGGFPYAGVAGPIGGQHHGRNEDGGVPCPKKACISTQLNYSRTHSTVNIVRNIPPLHAIKMTLKREITLISCGSKASRENTWLQREIQLVNQLPAVSKPSLSTFFFFFTVGFKT